jgi:hypothetical protein
MSEDSNYIYCKRSVDMNPKTCTATISGKTRTINSFGSDLKRLTMLSLQSTKNKIVVKAQPSLLSSDGTSFQVAWNKSV